MQPWANPSPSKQTPSTTDLGTINEASCSKTPLFPARRSDDAVHTAFMNEVATSFGKPTKRKRRWVKSLLLINKLRGQGYSSAESDDFDNDDVVQAEDHRRSLSRRAQYSKEVDSQYWLEMIDSKHRYGGNLKCYHDFWLKKSRTKQSFFYWLDHGEGKHLDLPYSPRIQLDSEQIRYLTKEERLSYLVCIQNGLLLWAKNDEKITTSTCYKDSKQGIVHQDVPDLENDDSHLLSLSLSSTTSSGSDIREDRYVDSRSPWHISPSALMNRLLRKTTGPNTWIFVTDPQWRIYIGLKQAGSFQHSSFLRGARVSSAGLIELQDGKITSLSPLSGHYRCSTKQFRRLIRVLKEKHVDLSQTKISKSYFILYALEMLHINSLANSKKRADKDNNDEKSNAEKTSAQQILIK
ncbi:IQ domain-containing protein IQM5 [Neolecta irregularis DAH-3]|uniref:IQ domain-containing protein IQM5 n=1 Tax=Neolecta irregularis (strain DAH-3) TaxID=1198029 RepID=A0A1U7LL23_NEOID|nr:IQ domain-containing protein IQM5 [Neolecta irregularis DAH-3]|eukprot:OLL23221.1 IQ domain-containing protein IQM5 [Neolecta irregularis DAH-3]